MREPRFDRFALILLGAALVLRLLIVFGYYGGVDPREITGDSTFYIDISMRLWRLGLPGLTGPEVTYPGEYITSIGPVYPLLLAFLRWTWGLLNLQGIVTQLTFFRLSHLLMDMGIVVMVYLIATRLFGAGVGRIALAAQALDPRYIYHVGVAQTELPFMLLFVLFMLLLMRGMEDLNMGQLRWAGVVLGLAVLTRPVPLLFPVILVGFAWFHPVDRRKAFKGLAWMVGMMLLVVSPWFARNALLESEFIPVASSFFSHVWRASLPEEDPDINDEVLRQEQEIIDPETAETQGSEYLEAAVENIAGEPTSFVGRIAQETILAHAQPYGTTFARPGGSPSALRTIAEFARGDSTFQEVLSLPGIVPRVLMYVWQYWALLGGAAGMVLLWREKNLWRPYPLYAWIIYATGVVSVLLIEPRYIFPTMFAYTILAALASQRLFGAARERVRRRTAGSEAAEPAGSAR